MPRLNIKSDAFPEMHGPANKAANTRSLVPYIIDLQRRATAMNPTRKHRHMLKVVESLQAAIDIFYSNGSFLSEETVTALARHLNKMGQNYQVLQNLAFQDKQTRWKTTVKMHYVVGHPADQATLINPKATQGYRSESMVGTVCTI